MYEKVQLSLLSPCPLISHPRQCDDHWDFTITFWLAKLADAYFPVAIPPIDRAPWLLGYSGNPFG